MTMSRRLKVLLAHISPQELPSFVRTDLHILESEFQVTPFRYRRRRDVPGLVAKVATHDVVVSWFAWDQAYWGNRAARRFHRGSVTIAGGFDVVRLPEIDYGNLLSPSNAQRTREALDRSDIILAVSESIAKDAATASGREDIRVVYHGFDESAYPFGPDKKQVALTVGEVTVSNLKRKGIATFVKAAAHLPDLPFLVVGGTHGAALHALGRIPPNVRFLGKLPDKELVKLMMESRVYVQASAHEGFGCSLAEAMLCGCVPVITNRGAIPEVVGDTGVYVEYGDPEETSRGIRDAMAKSDSVGRAARERITRLFPLEKRRDALIGAVHEVAP
jgi:glycosyltransferase involved in cell wall biosynthesis